MSVLKRWIARLFNIRAEDLPENPSTITPLENLDEKIRKEVSLQVREHLASLRRKSESDEPVIEKPHKPSDSPEVFIPEPQKYQDLREMPVDKNLDVIPDPSLPEFPAINLEEEFPEIIEHELKETDFPAQVEDEKRYPSITVEPERKEQPLPIRAPEKTIIRLDSSTTRRKRYAIPTGDQEQTHQTPSSPEEVLPLEPVYPEPDSESTATPLRLDVEEIRIGIDFGTTTTAISFKIGDMSPEALPIGSDGITRYIPSIVYFQPGPGEAVNRAIVGEEAEAFGEQAQVIRSVKRCLGCQGNNCHRDQPGGKDTFSPFPWCREDGKIHLSDTEIYDPAQVAYLIIREALRRALRIIRDQRKIDLTMEDLSTLAVNFGCGAKFDLAQRETIKDIASELGLTNITLENIVEEPILAGFTFSRFPDSPEGRILIYDFGGGTFDVAILDVDRNQGRMRVTVVATAGENWLGGDDIDNLVYRHFLGISAEAVSITADEIEIMLDPIERGRLRNMAHRAKENLSSVDTYSDVLLSRDLGPVNINLTRGDFEQLLAKSGLVDKSIKAVERACKLAFAFENAKVSAAIDVEQVIRHNIQRAAERFKRVILVGGVTKIPYIRSRLSAIFGDEKIVSDTIIEPISAVAIGGAYPREPQHYSICVPPFGFFLEYETPGKTEKSVTPIFSPYEYYAFHRFWTIGHTGEYEKDISITPGAKNVVIFSRKATDESRIESQILGKLSNEKWKFSASIEGFIKYHPQQGIPYKVFDFPTIHPVQQSIRDERQKRIDKEREEKFARDGDLEKWNIKIMGEN